MPNDAFAIHLTNQTKTHKEWLSVMRFGMNTLLEDEITLIECVVTEAMREKTRGDKPRNTQELPTIVWEILDELKLKLTLDA